MIEETKVFCYQEESWFICTKKYIKIKWLNHMHLYVGLTHVNCKLQFDTTLILMV